LLVTYCLFIYKVEYSNFVKIEEPIKSQKPRTTLKSQILSGVDRIKLIAKELKTLSLEKIIQDIVSEMSLNSHSIEVAPSGTPMWDIDQNLSAFLQFLNKEKKLQKDYWVLSLNDKHLICGIDFDQPVQEEYLKIRRSDRRDSKIKILNIIFTKVSNKKGEWRIFKLDSYLGNLNTLKGIIKNNFK